MMGKLATLLTFAGLASAWSPHERDMSASSHGGNLFKGNATEVFDRNGMKRWLPGKLPIRGVNLGSMFIIENWMASTEFKNIGCPNAKSEFDCVLAVGQSTANTNFAKHWNTWITQADIQAMQSYGLNTIRIPVGYWIFKELKYSSEHFPEGQLPFLDKIVGWASDAGFYIIIDLHGAPYAQTQDAFTGQLAAPPTTSNPDFFQSSQYERALQFLEKMTARIHGTNAYRNVGMIELVNEPIRVQNSLTQSMRSSYYPDAFSRIRAKEKSMSVTSNNYLHIQMMNSKWGSGDPTQYLTDNYFAAYDDHRYLKYDSSINPTQSNYIAASCADDRGGNWPTIVGEWSLSVNPDHENSDPAFYPVSNNKAFYTKWFNAQVHAYEKQDGWVFWSWKTSGLNDPRWDYQMAAQQGIIPNLGQLYNPC